MIRTLRPWLLTVAAATLLAAAPPATATPTPVLPAPGGGLPANARAQIEALAQAKAARTPAQNKVDSVLLTAAQQRAGRGPAVLRGLHTGIRTDRAGRTRVQVRGTVDAGLLARVGELGGLVRAEHRASGTLDADLPLSAVERLAALPQVRHVDGLAALPLVDGHVGSASADPSAPLKGQDAERAVRRRLAEAVRRAAASAPTAGRAPAAPTTGAVVSEGDAVHGVRQARAALGVSGVGITVAVLSDGIDSLAAAVASGDLPADVRVLPGQEGSGDEGTAMLELVHDLAPKATLAFATADPDPESFADNIRGLRAAGADVLVDDTLYLGESPFQDGPIAQAVLDVTHDGGLYFGSAGNQGNLDAGTSGNYEGTFSPSGETIGKFAGPAHDFDPGAGTQVVEAVPASPFGNVPAVLQWADPLGAAGDDYDLYAIDATGNVLAASNTVQDGDDDAFEGFLLPATATPVRLAVVKFRGGNRYLQLTAFGGRYVTDGAVRAFASPGVTRGHASVPAAFAVGAAPAAAPFPDDLQTGDPPNPSGPYPGVYAAGQHLERFTSDGPRRVFFTPRGTPLTPGNFSSTGGTVRAKPDLVAADGVRTSLTDFSPFFGTSAAAPHAAAIAALMLSGRPGLTPGQVRAALTGTALDVGAAGRDRDSGSGIVQAGAALRAVRARAQAYPAVGRAVVTASTDHDAFLEPGETALVRVPVTNVGDATATGVSVTVTTSTEGATVRPAIKSYGSIAAGATASHRFRVSVPSSAPLGSTVSLAVRVRFGGAFSPRAGTGSIPVGQPAKTVVVRYTGPDVDIPDNDPTGVSVSLPVRGVGPLSHVSFSIDGTKCSADDTTTTVGLQHTFLGDLVGTLRSPDGTAVRLFDRTGGAANNICQAVFDDSASRDIQRATSLDAPITGSWRPAQPLSSLVGRNGDGVWAFTVVDNAQRDTGVLRAFSLRVAGFVPPPSG